MTGETTAVRQRPWRAQDITLLRSHAHLGANQLAELLHRTPHAVRLQASRQRISLRQPGQPTGRILGDPPPPLRDLFRRDPTAATRISQAATNPAPLCPRCARRPQSPTLGICRPCHLTALADAHRAETAEQAARRDLDQARQAKHRARTR